MTRHKRLARAFIVATCLVAGASLGARLGRFHWAADLLAYFHDIYLYLALLLLAGLLLLGRYRWAALALGTLIFNAWLLLPYFPSGRSATSGERDLRLYVHNLYYENDDLAAVALDIERHDPDLVFFMEYSHAIGAQIEADFAAYPYRIIEPSRFTMGVAVFSRLPLERAEVRRFEATRIPILDLTLEVNGRSVGFVGGHPWPPIGRWGALHRAQMGSISAVADGATRPLIVAGDFNASPWSYTVARLEAAGLRDARRGFGLGKTWQLSPFFKLPIDEVLVSNDWQVLSFQQGERGGSDHAPLIVDLALP